MKTREAKMPNNTANLMERILHKENLNAAYLQVKRNGGAPGKDNLTVKEAKFYLKEQGATIIAALYEGSYKPKPVKRIMIPKPEGGERQLGIPTVVDRIIQQAIAQVLHPIYEEQFSENSYGFRPGKNCHMAIQKAKEYICTGNEYVVDIDLEKFFDTVNHDKLLSLMMRDIEDKRVLRLIRKYLQAGALSNGLYSATPEGTPQGSPLSPLLSNIVLNELDKELEKRGHLFCRYADDCNIYVGSIKAAERVMEGVTGYIEKRLKLKVNKTKSAIGRPYDRKFLGFGFYKGKDGEVKIRTHKKSVKRLKEKVKKIVSRSNGKSMRQRIEQLKPILRGWGNYFRIDELPGTMKDIDGWIRRRLRMCYWKEWKLPQTKYRRLVGLGAKEIDARRWSYSRKGYWAIAGSPILTTTVTNRHLESIGYTTLFSFTGKG